MQTALYMPVIPTLERLRQENHKIEAILICVMRPFIKRQNTNIHHLYQITLSLCLLKKKNVSRIKLK